MVTNGVLLDKRQPIFDHLNGLIVSLDAITHDPSEPMSKSAQIPKVLANLDIAKQKLPPGAITLSCVLELWNLDEAEKIEYNGQTYYEVELTRWYVLSKELIFTADGKETTLPF